MKTKEELIKTIERAGICPCADEASEYCELQYIQDDVLLYLKGMTGTEYQKAAMRTNDGKNFYRLAETITIGEVVHIEIAELIDGCMGLTGEAGEFCDLVKKFVFHSANLDHEHAKKELGDVCWYIAMICHAMGWNLDEILRMNIDKLKARYPEGFDTELSNHRKANDL